VASGVLIGRVFQLENHQRNTIDEQQHIRTFVVIVLDNRVLIDYKELVVQGIFKIHYTQIITLDVAIFTIFHRNTLNKHTVEFFVVGKQV